MESKQIKSAPQTDLQFMHRGRFLKIDYKSTAPEKRNLPDRRRSLRGDPSRSETGQERRKGSRRLEDVIITIEIKDQNQVYSSEEVFRRVTEKALQQLLQSICYDWQAESVLTYLRNHTLFRLETKLKYRDRIKEVVKGKGLEFEVIDTGAFLGNKKTEKPEESELEGENSLTPENKGQSEFAAILGFAPDSLKDEINNLIFKVFVRCLNEVHPVKGDHEKDAKKQNVSLEQRIIYMAGKHYPKSENLNFRTIVEQIFANTINEYNVMIHMEADISKLEERFELSKDQRLKTVIDTKNKELEKMKISSSLADTIRILYLYLGYFKDIIKIGSLRERIEQIFQKVNEKQIEVLNLETIYCQLQRILSEEEQIRQSKGENSKAHLGYFKWLKNEIASEIYFVRNLWINNMKGKQFIENAIQRTFQASKIQTDQSQNPG